MTNGAGKSLVLAALAIVSTAAANLAHAGPIATYLGGIGVAVPSAQNSPAASWAPSSIYGLSHVSGDFVGDYGYVGPGYGGQLYDIEALYVQVTSTQLIITGISGADLSAMPVGASGSCPSGPCHTFPVGDFFLGTGTTTAFNPVIGIELTGQHYDMDSHGYTVGWTSPLAAGSLVSVPGGFGVGYDVGLSILNYVGAPSQIGLTGYTQLPGSATIFSESINGHTAFQANVSLSLLGSFDPYSMIVSYGELCGNDFLRAEVSVPEPQTIPLLCAALGMLAFAVTRRRRVVTAGR